MSKKKTESAVIRDRNLDLYNRLLMRADSRPDDVQLFSDLFDLLCDIDASIPSSPTSHAQHLHLVSLNADLRTRVSAGMGIASEWDDFDDAEKFRRLLYRSYVFGARDVFEDFLIAMEFDRDPRQRFYQPRMHYLRRMGIISSYQQVFDGELDFLSISMPKRSGKSQTGINFVNFISGARPDNASLMEGSGSALVNSFYRGCLEYLDPQSEYHFYDIFPSSTIKNTSADLMTFNLHTASRFPTVMCRSIDSTQVGLSEATNLLYLDDCVEGREEALNRGLLDKKWEVISGDVFGRAIEGTPIVMCGTRYSLYDPIGRAQEEMRKQGKRMRVIEAPALDLITDESNYEYYNPKLERTIFTTKYFREQREMLSEAQFESEFQQRPFEEKGVTFPRNRLNYFFDLPQGMSPDAVIAFVDTAQKGSDYVAAGVGMIYGEDCYIADVVFDDSPPDATVPQVASLLMRWKCQKATFESNNSGQYYARDVSDILREKGVQCGIETKYTVSNKQTRIEMASANIIKHFWFKHESRYERNSQYAVFMRNVWQYTRSGKVPHDDGPDMLSMMENGIRGLAAAQVEVFKRPF